MDLIHTNSSREDVGVLLDYELDLAFGADENNFECTIQATSHCCEAGSFLYFEGTEYGGIVDSIKSNNSIKEVVYSGRTWHGVLNSKVIAPDNGEDYLTVSGEANAVIGTLLTRMGLSDLYEASSEDSGLMISNYKMNRYITGYDGITKMLASVGARIRIVFRGGKVIVSAVAKHDYSQNEEFDSDQVGFTIKKNYRAVNHLICLGSGELAERLVVHLYVDEEGNISQTQTQFGLAEVSAIYERSDLSTEDELISEGKERLGSLNDSDEVSIDFDADADSYEVGDVIGAYDNITGLYITTKIAKKIVTIKNGQITISLTPDTAKVGSVQEIGGGGDFTSNEYAATDLSNVSLESFIAKNFAENPLYRYPVCVTMTSEDGENYVATIPGLTSDAQLQMRGVIQVIPQVGCSVAKPTLNVNGFGARTIHPSNGETLLGYDTEVEAGWLKPGLPVTLLYVMGRWVAVDPTIRTLKLGGTGANNAADARTNLGVYSEAEVDEKFDELEQKVADLEITGGTAGEDGATFTPSVSDEGDLSWSNDKGLPNPDTVNIMGPHGPAGATGPAGPTGATGKTAYEYAKEGGYTGTEEEFSEQIAKEFAEIDLTNVAIDDFVAKNFGDTTTHRFAVSTWLTSEDGENYTATIPGVDNVGKLQLRVVLYAIPTVNSSVAVPTLDINGLGAKQIRPSNGTTAAGDTSVTEPWLKQGFPVPLIYNGMHWIAIDTPIRTIKMGGTGATTAADARANLEVYSQDEVVGQLSGYLPLAGGTMAGPIKFNAASLPGKSLAYICGVDAFTAGGEMGWQSKTDFLSGYATTTQINTLQTAINGKQPSGSYAVTNAANTFSGEQKMVHPTYAPTMNDIASGIGCSLKNARACDNQLIVAEVIAPLTAATDSTSGMKSTAGEIPFYKITGASNGQPTGKTQMAKITGSGIYEGTTLLADKYAPKSHTHDYLPLSGGTLTGNLTGQYITGTWLQTTAASNYWNNTGKIAVLDGGGWVYYRTPAQILGDIGAAETDLSNVSDANFVGRAINSSCSFFPIMAALDSSDGVTFTATVPGLTSLDAFAVELRGIAMAYGSTSKTPKLNVNGLGAYTMKPFNGNIWSGGTPSSTSWLAMGVPYSMIFNGSEWIVFKYSYTT